MAGSAGKRYDLFMNNLTERTWMAVPMGVELKKLMEAFVKYPPRKLQSLGYTGPITISEYQRLEWLRDQMKKEGVISLCRQVIRLTAFEERPTRRVEVRRTRRVSTMKRVLGEPRAFGPCLCT
jgi:hypothetical protein